MIVGGTYYKSYRNWLLSEWEQRQLSNSQFSLRAYARYINIDRTTISAVLAGKRKLSYKNALKIASKFALSDNEKTELLQSIQSEYITNYAPQNEILQLEEEKFRVMADWYHSAILCLANLTNNSSDPKWIAERIGISESKASSALQRLVSLKLLTTSKGKLIPVSTKLLSVHSEKPSLALRRHHKQNLNLAEDSLDHIPNSLKDISFITVPANPKQMEECRKVITNFRRKMKSLLQSGESSEVYTLSIQLFPVTKVKDTSI